MNHPKWNYLEEIQASESGNSHKTWVRFPPGGLETPEAPWKEERRLFLRTDRRNQGWPVSLCSGPVPWDIGASPVTRSSISGGCACLCLCLRRGTSALDETRAFLIWGQNQGDPHPSQWNRFLAVLGVGGGLWASAGGHPVCPWALGAWGPPLLFTWVTAPGAKGWKQWKSCWRLRCVVLSSTWRKRNTTPSLWPVSLCVCPEGSVLLRWQDSSQGGSQLGSHLWVWHNLTQKTWSHRGWLKKRTCV